MALINCKDRRNTCGTPLPSTCVSYDGAFTGILENENFNCDVNIDDIFERLSVKIKNISDLVDSIKQQDDSNKEDIDALQEDIFDIRNIIEHFTASQVYVNIDLTDLGDVSTTCVGHNREYLLSSILNLLKNEIVYLKSKII